MLAARAGLVPGLPLMHPAFYIRPARVEEAAALSDLWNAGRARYSPTACSACCRVRSRPAIGYREPIRQADGRFLDRVRRSDVWKNVGFAVGQHGDRPRY